MDESKRKKLFLVPFNQLTPFMKKGRKCLVLICSSLYVLLVVLSVATEVSGGLGREKNRICVLSSCDYFIFFVYIFPHPPLHSLAFLLGVFQLMKLHTGSDSYCRMDMGSIHMHNEMLWDSQDFLSE